MNGKHSRRTILKQAALSPVATPLFGQTSPKKPNLLFVFSDQQSYDMLGASGYSQVLTPRTDQFCQTGLRFDHCVSNSPVCTPFRGMLLSGQHPLYNNAFSNDRQLRVNGQGFGDVLQSSGYRTGWVGKWHLYGGDRNRGVPIGEHRHGFDSFLTNNCHVNFEPGKCFYWDQSGKKKVFFRDQWEADGQTDQALDFLDRQAADDDPFALFVSWHPPHNHGGGDRKKYQGFDAPEEFKALYDESGIQVRKHMKDSLDERNRHLGYMAMCSEVDHHFGRLLDKLKEKGLDKNTIVVFTSDHGESFMLHDRPTHKCGPEDVSCRVPLVMRVPGMGRAGEKSDLLIGAIDLMPTILSLMGIEPPGNLHGQDLAAAIRSGDDDAVEALPLFFYHNIVWHGAYTRDRTYAFESTDRIAGSSPEAPGLIRKMHQGPRYDVLYDRNNDPWQTENRFSEGGRESADLDAFIRDHMKSLKVPIETIQEIYARYEKNPDWLPG